MHETILLGLVCLAAPWMATLAGYDMHRKPFDLVGVAGIFFMLAAGLTLGMAHFAFMGELVKMMVTVSYGMGCMGLILGAFRSVVEVIREPEHRLMHR